MLSWTSSSSEELRNLRIARIGFLISFVCFGLMAAGAIAFVAVVLWHMLS